MVCKKFMLYIKINLTLHNIALTTIFDLNSRRGGCEDFFSTIREMKFFGNFKIRIAENFIFLLSENDPFYRSLFG